MARVLCATQPWGVIWDRYGNAQSAVAVAIDGNVYADSTGSDIQTPLITNADGEIPGWIESGTYELTIGSETKQIEALAADAVLDSLADIAATISSEMSTHAADTTAVHGIADTSALATGSDVEVVADAVAAEASARAAADAAHAADTTGVHGIADTAALVVSSDVRAITQITQAAYDALVTPDPSTLYVIVG